MKIRREVYEKHMVEVTEGQMIFAEGEEGKEMYVIISGEFEISKRTSYETSKTLITLKKGDVFGEMALIDSMPRSATVIAKKPGQLLMIDDALFYTLARTNTDFAFKMIKALSERIRKSNEQISRLASENCEVRTIRGLAEYATEHGRQGISGMRIDRGSFYRWAEQHLGLRSTEVQTAIIRLIADKAVLESTIDGEIILPRRLSKIASR